MGQAALRALTREEQEPGPHVGALTREGREPGPHVGGAAHSCARCGLGAVPSTVHRRLPHLGSAHLDFCMSFRKPRKPALCLFLVGWLQPWLPFPFRRGSADPASPMLSRVYFTWPEVFWPSGGGTSQRPSPRKPPGSGNVFCEGPGSEYFSKISSKLTFSKSSIQMLTNCLFFYDFKEAERHFQMGLFKL